ncbi:phage terminase large subunit [Acinetobacter nosocomialis]|uniref:phage terminase large subunit n=1 Tax=Acinetobacter nosocomialis TaxID=106654 RepID=UPI0019623A58|nr:phage terminase large subunit [Acinetobacter nosocomialis]MBM9551724.1 phage terminase large subunit [Acinetobacter nosocomialis]MBO8212876.1 phage terminase large subunit [Acinetobacter nosocomialis]MBR7736755.1 phage terminase large subunit [Acinetobacter nosocomialis]MCU4551609.1 phage terminase large subunit [Acinetobacter nosocomialis]
MNSRTNIDPVKTKAKRIKCEKEHLFFTRAFFLPRMGFKFSVNWHHEYIADKIDEVIAGKVKNLVINVPPGSGKTELLTNLIARGIARNARSRFLYLSYSQSLVEDVSATARNIVKSEDFQRLWPVKISTSTDAKSSWKTTVDGYDAGHVYSASMGGQVTGRRAGTLANEGFTGAIILDDPLKPEDAFSRTARRKANRKILNTVNSRKAKSDTPIILIMQRLHVEDPTNFVLTGNVPGEWEQISIPALIDDEYISKLPEKIQRKIPRDVERDEKGRQSYWPLKESLQSLLQLEKGGQDKDGATVSRYTFASQYQQAPKKLGGDLVKSEWFPRYLELPVLKWRAIWADTAQKVKKHNDYSVFLCAGLGYDNNLYIIDVKRGKWEAPALLKVAKDFIKKHKDGNTKIGKLRYMAVEDKASGTGLIQTIAKETTLPIRAIQRGDDKLLRSMDVILYVEDGRVLLPAEAPWLLNYVEEIEGLSADWSHDHDDQWDPTIDAINDSIASKPTVFD